MTDLALESLVRRGLAREVVGDAKVRVRGIRHHSKRVEKGDLFAAIRGVYGDGADHVDEAIRNGAVAVMADRRLKVAVPLLLVDDALASLSELSRCIYGDPGAQLTVVGITGTNGKTTTAHLLEGILQASGAKTELIGTIHRGAARTTPTTPMADDLMRILRDAVVAGVTHVVLEVTSHGLAMRRADGVDYRVAALTNLSRDHLDYHGDFESYRAAKRRLFTELSPRCCVLNVDDAFGAELAARLETPRIRVSSRPTAQAEVRVRTCDCDASGIRVELITPRGSLALESPLIGEHNVDNMLVAAGCAEALGIEHEHVAAGIARVPGVPGRLERIDNPGGALLAVDYAHTPDALLRVLTALRPLTKGRLWVVFGCGGDRDVEKRPLMGEVAAHHADLVVVTSDNPRTENPSSIIAQIEGGIERAGDMPKLTAHSYSRATRGYIANEDRRAAIQLAIAAARPDDSVLIAGKGHETVQVVGEAAHPFDDRLEARHALERMAGRA